MSDHHEHDDHVHFEKIMPFVVCQSEGGPYDDVSFVAGFRMGQIDETVRMARAIGTQTIVLPFIADDCRAQVDLIAMRYGFRVEFRTTGTFGDGWCEALLTLTGEPV